MNSKRLLHIILVLLLAIFLANIFVACDTNNSRKHKPTDGLTFSDWEEDTCWVVDMGTAVDKDIVVPANHDGKRVVGIASGAFQNQNITSIVIPEGVETIQMSAFYACRELKSVKLPSTLTRIEDGAFGMCGALESFEFPANLSYLGNGVFRQCVSLKTIDLPASISTLPRGTFEGCGGLENVVIPSNIKVVEENAFGYCSNLASIRFEGAPDLLKASCFISCDSLKKVDVGTLEDWLHIDFESTSSNPLFIARKLYVAGNELTSLELTEGVEKINDYAFANCIGLKRLLVGGSVKTVGDYAFFTCNSLEEVVLQDGIETIGAYAFNGCFSFGSINFPASIKRVGNAAFMGTMGMKKVEITDLCAWTQIVFDDNIANPLVNAHKLYLNGEEIKDLVIPDSVERINAYAFACGNFETVTIPENTCLIGDGAFEYCQQLREVSFGSGVRIIGYNAFSECRMLKVNIADLKSWCESDLYDSPAKCAYAFCVNGENLTNLVIPNSTTKIGYGAFSNIGSITEVHIPNGIEEIGSLAFYQCNSCEAVYFDGTVAEWNAIQKANYWNTLLGASVIHCTDGDVDLQNT